MENHVPAITATDPSAMLATVGAWTVGDLQDIVAVSNLILRNRKSTFVNAPEEVIQAAQSAAKSCNLSARLHWWHVVDLASLRIIAAHNIRQRK
jgi:hypothetical protein